MSKPSTISKTGSRRGMVRVKADGTRDPIKPRSFTSTSKRAATDTDNLPLTAERVARMRQSPRVRILRRALGLTQEAFAKRYGIPLGTLRDWEQGRREPDQPARAYLRAIAGDPNGVAQALSTSHA